MLQTVVDHICIHSLEISESTMSVPYRDVSILLAGLLLIVACVQSQISFVCYLFYICITKNMPNTISNCSGQRTFESKNRDRVQTKQAMQCG